MLNIRNEVYKPLSIDKDVTRKYAVKLEELREGQKISIMSDTMFKTMFMNSKRMKYGAKLLSYFLDISYEELLTKLRLSKNELDKNNIYNKSQRCDYVANINDSIINIEVNCHKSLITLERNMEYAYRLYASGMSVGDEYKYNQVIQLNLNNFAFLESDETFDIFYIQNNNQLKLTNKLIFIQISVPNLRKKCYNESIEKLTDVERFILSLVETDIDSAMKCGNGDNFMEESIKEQTEFCLTDDLRESYDKEIAMQKEYLREGEEIGFEKGIEKGIKTKTIQIIKNMSLNGFDIETISKILDTSIEEVKEVLKEI